MRAVRTLISSRLSRQSPDDGPRGRIVAVPTSVGFARVRNDKIVKNSDGNGVANVSQCIKFQHVPVLMSYVSILLT